MHAISGSPSIIEWVRRSWLPTGLLKRAITLHSSSCIVTVDDLGSVDGTNRPVKSPSVWGGRDCDTFPNQTLDWMYHFGDLLPVPSVRCVRYGTFIQTRLIEIEEEKMGVYVPVRPTCKLSIEYPYDWVNV